MAINKDGLEAGQIVDFTTLMRVKRSPKIEEAEPVSEPEKPKRGRKSKDKADDSAGR